MVSTAYDMPGSRSTPFSLDELEDILIYFSSSIMEKNDEAEVLWDVVRNCIAKLNLVDCVIYFVDDRRKVLIQKAAYGPKSPNDQEILKPISIPLGTGITGTVAITGIPEIIVDTRKDGRYIVDDEMRLSEIAVPVFINRKVIGVIDCEHPRIGYFTQQHLRILSAIASFLAARLSWIRAEKKVAQKQQILLRTRQEASDLKIKALRAQMNPHFVFNAINAIQHFITLNDKKSALNYLSLFSKLLRFYLQYLDEDSIRISDEMKILTWYLTLQELRYEGKIHVQIDALPVSGEIRIPALITQLFLEERVERLITAQNGKSTLNVGVRREKESVVVSLRITNSAGGRDIKRAKTYREDLPKWSDHVKLINRVKKYKIKTTSKHNVGGSRSNAQARNETHELILPVLE
jgi:putative methionine-R-sulfoxide reductase with GAF domain